MKQKLMDDLIELGVLRERQRIIALLKQQDKFIERGQFNEYDLIALIKEEN